MNHGIASSPEAPPSGTNILTTARSIVYRLVLCLNTGDCRQRISTPRVLHNGLSTPCVLHNGLSTPCVLHNGLARFVYYNELALIILLHNVLARLVYYTMA